MQKIFQQHVPVGFDDKILVVDVGPDRFGTPFHPELQAFVQKVAASWKERDWKFRRSPIPNTVLN
jgi:hypothetical protein